ncbi:hypothetical protein KIL84_008526 [Mauremys mutica]|uniref:Cocaine- and amphetamine-regulated transcript protein n=1 Tax=Mauremys mutica TaxID=74926 RepID=A0A9D3X8B0_9SAUR|nr:hypothetical protein KIL84_008526 [Mauremys mutica]
MIEALQEVLEKLKTERLPAIEKKLGSVPSVLARQAQPRCYWELIVSSRGRGTGPLHICSSVSALTEQISAWERAVSQAGGSFEPGASDRLVQPEWPFSPQCDAGELCAVRKGARIGRLCTCPRGTACNFYILKCL